MPIEDSELLWGTRAIARAIGRTERQTFHLLEKRLLPAKRVGGRWVASRRRLIAALTDDSWQRIGDAVARVVEKVSGKAGYPKEALPWLAEVERVFPGATQDIILVRKPNSVDYARPEIGNATARKGKVK